ncbi:NAD-dependent epimerase/dehydratase family protein [Candidatus Parcubacteria bacterium]|nr:NAD-dependent epimerase/dehydratase family protein [Candidatus Parcubacteria bacterium]MBI4385346.1 NAD-dependent epimerase/dehydratase family protein [Candidatus Parcubacteria bacterium]
MAPRSYLITGGYGLIGSALANASKGKITILSRSAEHKERLKVRARVLLKNLLTVTAHDVRGSDIIFHCASTVDNYNVLTNPYADVENITGTIKLLEACKDQAKKPKLFFLSTFFVYGNEYSRGKRAINEESKTEPLGIYPATKLCCESIIKLYSRLYGIPYIICRLTNVYSERESFDNKKKGALNFLIMGAVKGESLTIYKGGNFRRDYIYLDDVVSAVKFLEKEHVVNDTFLIGYGKAVLFRKLIEYVHQLTYRKSEIIEVEPPQFHKVVGITDFVANTSKINKLGWKPMVGYKEGLGRIVKTYKSLVSQ